MYGKEENTYSESQKKALQQLRELIKQQRHFIQVRTDPEFLGRFLKLADFNVQDAYKRYDYYYSRRNELKQWFLNRDPFNPENKHQLELGQILPLPGVDSKGRKVILVRGGLYNPKELDVYLKMQYVVMDLVAMDPTSQTEGVVLLVDQEKFTFKHSVNCSFADTKNAVACWQDAYPIRHQGVYLFKAGKAYDTLFNMIRTFMNNENKERFIVIGSDLNKLHQFCPVEILPEEYGGKAGPLQNLIDEWKNKVQSYRQMYLTEDEQYPWIDETKRNLPVKKKDNGAKAKFQTSLSKNLHAEK